MTKWIALAVLLALGYAVRAVWRPPQIQEEEDEVYEEPHGIC